MTARDHNKTQSDAKSEKVGKKAGSRAQKVRSPRGTRDLYPDEQAKQLYLFDMWRQTARRHGFDEINGPTFEHLDLYTIKSGEGIVSELFSFTRAGGDTALALRPEFTPTLARMASAKGSALAKPTKWFSIGPYFRAERPQRGRLREFVQWNVDVLGGADDDAQMKAEQDAEVIACCIDSLRALGLTKKDVRIRINHRESLADLLAKQGGVGEGQIDEAIAILDLIDKLDDDGFEAALKERLGFDDEKARKFRRTFKMFRSDERFTGPLNEKSGDPYRTLGDYRSRLLEALPYAAREWCDVDVLLARGLAYYTGMVFEVHEAGGKERAIAGGGRYDNLVELFGGPSTPAVGFAMGDVVLALVLEDRGKMLTGAGLYEAVGARPDVFVISTGEELSEQSLRQTVAELREAGLHARHSYKTTRKRPKLHGEAKKCSARFLATIEDGGEVVTLENLETGEQDEVARHGLADELKSRLAM